MANFCRAFFLAEGAPTIGPVGCFDLPATRPFVVIFPVRLLLPSPAPSVPRVVAAVHLMLRSASRREGRSDCRRFAARLRILEGFPKKFKT
jgi:hypothetical protein